MATTVLIVDDDPIFVDTLVFVLSHAGFATRVAYNGASALQILHRDAETIDIIILDIMLPDMDGFEVCREIRNEPSAAKLPILMLSALTETIDRRIGFESGADDYVAKPANPRELVSRLLAALILTQRGLGGNAPVLTFVGVKGGVGTTTTALNLALSLVASKRVVFVELGNLGLAAAWTLGIQPEKALCDLGVSDEMPLSMPMLQSCITVHSSGLYYLTGYPQDATRSKCKPGVLAQALNMLQAWYDCVVIDLGVSATPTCTEALIHSTQVIPVAEMDRLSIWHLRTMMDRLAQDKIEGKVPGVVLVDQYATTDTETPTELANAARMDILAVIPAAGNTLYESNRRQQPLAITFPQSPAYVAIADLGKRLIEQANQVIAAAKSGAAQ